MSDHSEGKDTDSADKSSELKAWQHAVISVVRYAGFKGSIRSRSRLPLGSEDSPASQPANERMQLTWLTGCPIRVGLGSPACRRAGRPRFTRHAADASR